MKTSIITALITLALNSIAHAQGDPLGSDPFAQPRATRDAIEAQPRRFTDRAWLVPEGTVTVRADGDLAGGAALDPQGVGRLYGAVGLTPFLDLGVSGRTHFSSEVRGAVELAASAGVRVGPVDLQLVLGAGPADLGGREVLFSFRSELNTRFHVIDGLVMDAGAFVTRVGDGVSDLGGHAGFTVSPTEAWWIGGQVVAHTGERGWGRLGLTAGYVFAFDDHLLDVGASVAYIEVGVQAGLTATLWMPGF